MYNFNRENLAYGRRITSAFTFLINMAQSVDARIQTFNDKLNDINLKAANVEIQKPKTLSSAVPVDYLRRFTSIAPICTSRQGVLNNHLLRVVNPNDKLRYVFFEFPNTSGILHYNPTQINGSIINTLSVSTDFDSIPDGNTTLGQFECFDSFNAIELRDQNYIQTPPNKLTLTKVQDYNTNGIYLFTGVNALTLRINGFKIFDISSPNSTVYTVQRIRTGDVVTGNYTDIFKLRSNNE